MRIYAKPQSDLHAPTLTVIHHDGVELTWPTKLMDKLVWSTPMWPGAGEQEQLGMHREAFEALFADLNLYWGQLSETKQANLFALYKKIDQIFEAVPHDVTTMQDDHYRGVCNALRKQVRHLNEALPADALVQWWKELYPETGEYAAALSDFKAAAFSFRPLVPVLMRFVDLFTPRTGTVLKEMEAYKLVVGIGFDTTSAMARVRQYVSASVAEAGGPDKDEGAGPVFFSMNQEEFNFWILSLVVVRRLSITPLHTSDGETSPIAFVYKYIGQKVKVSSNSFLPLVTKGNDALRDALK